MKGAMRAGAVAVAMMSAVMAAAEPAHPLLPAARPDIVILGEVHDNPEHHRIQAEVVAALQPAALVFEMLTPDQAAAAADLDDRSSDALRAALDWDDSSWPDFDLYYPIFAAAPGAAIVGAALPRADLRRAMSAGAAAAFGAQAAEFGLAAPLSGAEQAMREALQMAAHCDALPESMLPGMVEAQRLRDAAFSRAALDALSAHGGPVVVIAGWGHAHRNWGMPRYLEGHLTEGALHTIGLVEEGADIGEPLLFDRMVVTAPASRPDPCAGLRAKAQDRPTDG